MGQYYKPVNKTKREWLYSHDYGNGLKLMEHSYVGNNFVEAVEKLLTKFGPWYKDEIVWAGDYADGEEGTQGIEHIDGINLYSWASGEDPDRDENKVKLSPFEIDKLLTDNKEDFKDYHFVVNHTGRQFVDKRKCPNYGDENAWCVHPLPLLTAEGNGRGGGDYDTDGPDSQLIGIWARCSISVEKEIPEGYDELEVHFKE